MEGNNQNVEANKEESAILNILIASLTMLFAIQKNYFIYYKTKAIIFIIALTSIYAFTVVDSRLEFVIALFFFVSFLELVDHFLWKYPPFCWMFTIEDFSGTYKGRQVGQRLEKIGGMINNDDSICREYEKPLKLTLIIHQTGSKIITHSFYYDSGKRKTSKSESNKVMVVRAQDGKHFTLSYHYGSISVLKNGGHHGTAILKLIKKENRLCLEGGYYTNKNPQTRGEFINLKRISKQTIHPF